ncbi:hypothetical protein C7460_11721 [Marinoscillum furvescens DSM 4134]|uniref:Uncharacterized protein n=1 Tax=Marinoscillum furvescens DSM 4134 TaxID=1122208 RepID=A0A3D9KZ55_MARFU|nr:hypothetical protein C7460_11721 [Marinoscillum furvescens DSM 4134]
MTLNETSFPEFLKEILGESHDGNDGLFDCVIAFPQYYHINHPIRGSFG